MELNELQRGFVLHWGEMGARWGVNRTIAQIHALLYLSDTPVCAEEITDTLGLARSGVSVALRELERWGLLCITHELGDRRDHYSTMEDPWEMFRVILCERKKREIDPTLKQLNQWLHDAEQDPETSKDQLDRVRNMLECLKTLDTCYAGFQNLSPKAIQRLMKMGDQVFRLTG